ncbi:CAN9 protein, partial [Amia calva]|nr:CAN9 protein [Amia calva]
MPYSYESPSSGGGSEPVKSRSTQSDGKSFEQLRRECLQRNVLFEDPDFPATGKSLYYSQQVPVNIVWKRPGEFQPNPKFVIGGATRTDICQGELGDCWLLAAIASLTLNEKVLMQVVPHDQTFDQNYAGIFHFQFWQHNEWLDVIVDDKLPTVRNRLVFLHSAESNEFWSALLEKAYAKLNGSYEALKGGSTLEAMEDFTGGVGEIYETKQAPNNLFQIMGKALQRGSMMGCSIDITSSAESEARTTTGLVKGHAYSITGLDEVQVRGRKVQLIRIRNPWGQVEWNGPWSDNSREWSMISAQDQKRLNQVTMDDGEFWMDFEDFKTNYDKIEICNLTADSLDDDITHKWEVATFEGNWVRGSTAGGCRNFIDTFWTNPQFKLKLKDTDDHHDKCTFIAALMQKNRRKLRKEGLDLETIGFAIYQAPNEEDHLSKDFFRYNPSKARSKTYINVREISERFTLPPGNYLLVPTTFQPHKEADFLLRIFSEKQAESLEMGNTIEAALPDPPMPSPPAEESEEEKGLRRLFNQIAGSVRGEAGQVIEGHSRAQPEGMFLVCDTPFSLLHIPGHGHQCQRTANCTKWCAEETDADLCFFLGSLFVAGKEIKFDGLSINTCHSIINLMDVSFLYNSGQLEFQEFKIFWDKLKKWIMLFLTHDTDRTGSMSSYELRTALKAAGIQLNNKMLQLLALRFADSRCDLSFDDYLACIVRLENMFRVFQALDQDNTGDISMNFQQVNQI